MTNTYLRTIMIFTDKMYIFPNRYDNKHQIFKLHYRFVWFSIKKTYYTSKFVSKQLLIIETAEESVL